MSPLPPLPKRPKLPASPAGPLREIVREGRQLLSSIREDIRSIGRELRSSIAPETPTQTETKTKPESEEACPVCSEMTNLKEYLGKRKVKKALSDLEKGEGNKEQSVETVRKYIEGEEID